MTELEMCRDCGTAHADPAVCPGDDQTATHPDHDGLRARHLDHWTCHACDRHARLDRWMEAILAGRLRFHYATDPRRYVDAIERGRDAELNRWRAVYIRWRELHRAGWPNY